MRLNIVRYKLIFLILLECSFEQTVGAEFLSPNQEGSESAN